MRTTMQYEGKVTVLAMPPRYSVYFDGCLQECRTAEEIENYYHINQSELFWKCQEHGFHESILNETIVLTIVHPDWTL